MKALSVLALGLISILATAQDRPFHYNISETPQRAQGVNKAAALVGEVPGSNPWVTDGGTRRTAVMSEGELVDKTLQVEIDNTGDIHENNTIGRAMIKAIVEKDGMLMQHIVVPVEFDVTSDEEYVDHYEVVAFQHNMQRTYPITDAEDNAYGEGIPYLYEAINNPGNHVYRVERNKDNNPGETGIANHYEAFKLVNTNPMIYTASLCYDENAGVNGTLTLTIFVKAVYLPETGLTPTYHSLQNVSHHYQKIVTAVDDIDVEDTATPVYYDLNGRMVDAEMGLAPGIYVKRTGMKSQKILVR